MTQLQSSDAAPNARHLFDWILNDGYLYASYREARAMVSSMYPNLETNHFHASRRYFQEYNWIVSSAQRGIETAGEVIAEQWQVLDLLQAAMLLAQHKPEE